MKELKESLILDNYDRISREKFDCILENIKKFLPNVKRGYGKDFFSACNAICESLGYSSINESLDNDEAAKLAIFCIEKQIDTKVVEPSITIFNERKRKDKKEFDSLNKKLSPVELPFNIGQVEYMSGMTINVGNGEMKKFSTELTLPTNEWRLPDALFVAKEFCDKNTIADTMESRGRECKRPSENLNYNFDDLYVSPESIVSFKHFSSKTIPLGNFESFRVHIGVKLFSSPKNFNTTCESVKKFISEEMDKIECELKQVFNLK